MTLTSMRLRETKRNGIREERRWSLFHYKRPASSLRSSFTCRPSGVRRGCHAGPRRLDINAIVLDERREILDSLALIKI